MNQQHGINPPLSDANSLETVQQTTIEPVGLYVRHGARDTGVERLTVLSTMAHMSKRTEIATGDSGTFAGSHEPDGKLTSIVYRRYRRVEERLCAKVGLDGAAYMQYTTAYIGRLLGRLNPDKHHKTPPPLGNTR